MTVSLSKGRHISGSVRVLTRVFGSHCAIIVNNSMGIDQAFIIGEPVKMTDGNRHVRRTLYVGMVTVYPDGDIVRWDYYSHDTDTFDCVSLITGEIVF